MDSEKTTGERDKIKSWNKKQHSKLKLKHTAARSGCCCDKGETIGVKQKEKTNSRANEE